MVAAMVAKSNDFPVAYNGNNYNLKRFLKDHPGGVNTLEMYKGKSIVQAMKSYGHSTGAYYLLGDFKVSEDGQDSNLTGAISENGRIITKEEANRDAEEIALLEELEGRLDWSKPLLAQLDAIAPHYDKWVNSPVHRKCRLFANPILESLTCTRWYTLLIFWIPVILFLIVTTYNKYLDCGDSCGPDSLNTFQYSKHIIKGLLIWTVMEYTLHRWVFHFNPGTSPTMIKLSFLIHGIHHKVPFDGLRQVFPPVPAAVIIIIIYNTMYKVISYPLITVIGNIIGYLCYDMMHYYVHHGSPQDGSYLYAMKRYHSNHHFINHDKAFGISSKVWDHVFKTFVQIKKLNISLSW